MTDFAISRVEVTANGTLRSAFEVELRRLQLKRQAGAPHFNPAREAVDADEVPLLTELLELSQARIGGSRGAHVLHAFHGCSPKSLASILEVGLEPLGSADDRGYFGHGVYLTPQLEYAASYACGDLTDGGHVGAGGPKEWPVLLVAVSFSLAKLVTRQQHYPPNSAGSRAKSELYGQGMGAEDLHFAAVARHEFFQAVSPAAACDYHELVAKASGQCLPMAVVWVRRA